VRIARVTQQRIVHPEPHPRPMRRRLRAISLAPTAATLGNLVCGMLAVVCALLAMREAYFPTPPRLRHELLVEWFPSYIAVGAYLVVLSMLFDALDGRLARITRRTSEFGAQLDSISDIVSFGLAPAILFVALLLPLAVPADGAAALGKLEWRFALLGAVVYVSCAAIRLARFNVENTADASVQKKFSGLPVPGAAAAMVALLVLHEDPAYTGAWAVGVRAAIGGVAYVLGLLMVSRLDYVHVFNVYVRRRQPPTHLLWLLVIAAIGWYSTSLLLVVMAYAYLLSGLVLNWRRLRPAGTTARAAPQADENAA